VLAEWEVATAPSGTEPLDVVVRLSPEALPEDVTEVVFVAEAPALRLSAELAVPVVHTLGRASGSSDLLDLQLLPRFGLAELPIAESGPAAQAGFRHVMRAASVVERTEVPASDLDRMYAARGLAKRFLRTYEVPSLEMAVLRDAQAVGHAGLVVSPMLGVLDESWFAANVKIPRMTPLNRLLQAPREEQSVECAAVTWVGTFEPHKINHYHFHAEHLTALLQVEAFAAAKPDLQVEALVPSYGPKQAEIVELLGIEGVHSFRTRGSGIRARELLFPSAVRQLPRVVEPLLASVLQRIRANAAARRPHAGQGPRIVYVSRLDSGIRRMRNEADLVARMRALGAEIFLGRNLSYLDQVLAFRDAKLVIGPHGAGLTNIGFAPPGALTVEIFSSNFCVEIFARLAGLLGHRYRCFTQPVAAVDPDDPTSWDLDVEAFLAFLDPILNELYATEH